MGINLDPAVSVVVHNIMRHAPATAILASATMPSWDSLPFWWKVRSKHIEHSGNIQGTFSENIMRRHRHPRLRHHAQLGLAAFLVEGEKSTH
jgi:hypothetical protein